MTRKGFALIELLVAMFVLVFGILAVFAVFSFTFKGISHSDQRVHAVEVAKTYIELIRSRNLVPFGTSFPAIPPGDNSGLFDSSTTTRSLNYQPFANDFSPSLVYTRNIEITLLGTTGYQNNIAVIQVEIFWTEKGVQKTVKLTAYQHQP